jgi:hypothetical protein
MKNNKGRAVGGTKKAPADRLIPGTPGGGGMP